MTIKKGYTLTHIGREHIILPVGEETVHFDGLIHINDIGCFLFEKLSSDMTLDALLEDVLAEYEIDEKTARRDVKEFLDQLLKQNIIDA